MKYKPELYAKALAEIIESSHPKETEIHLIKNFIKILEKNGDSRRLHKIIELTERELHTKSGTRKIVMETARPLPRLEKKIQTELAKPRDVFETRVNPELVAGVKITINETLQFDATLKRKLEKLFS